MRIILPAQIQAARALLGWSQSDLAKKARSSRATVHRIESRGAAANESITALKVALEKAGVRFIAPTSSRGAGVSLRKRKR